MDHYDYLTNSENRTRDDSSLEAEWIDMNYPDVYIDFEEIIHNEIMHLILSN